MKKLILGLFASLLWIATPAAAQVTLTAPDVECSEAIGGCRVTALKSALGSGQIKLRYTTHDGAGTTGAKAGIDYTARTANLTISQRYRQLSFLIPIINNTTYKGDRSFLVNFTLLSGNAVFPDRSVVVKIKEDEPAPTILATLSVDDVNCTESIGSCQVTFRKDKLGTNNVTFGWSTKDGSALAASDYSARSGTLSIPTTGLTATALVPILNDTSSENPESLNVVLSGITGATAGKTTGIITIEDDDPATKPCPDGTTVPSTAECPIVVPPPPGDTTCEDGTTIPAGGTCPLVTWYAAPLAPRGYARAREACDSTGTWKVAGPKADGTYDVISAKIVGGNVYRVIVGGVEANGSRTWALELGNGETWHPSLGGGPSAYFPERCLEGVRPSS
jgi:hypothetical protein